MSNWKSFKDKAINKVYNAASKIDGGSDYIATATHNLTAAVRGKDSRIHLKSGNAIQLISRSSCRTVQIIMSSTNELICDAIGGTGPEYPNAIWTIFATKNGHYYFHNNYNYLAMARGKVIIIPSSMNLCPPREAEFRVHDVLGSVRAIYLEPVIMGGSFLGFDENGRPCEQVTVQNRDTFGQFEVVLIHRATYGDQASVHEATANSHEEPPPPYWQATAQSKR